MRTAQEGEHVAREVGEVGDRQRPTDAMRTPPIAGPTIIPRLPANIDSAAAAGISSLSTRRGMSESREGRWRPLSADMSAAAT